MQNTLESLLAEILRREANSLEIIQKLFDLTVSNSDTVILEYQLTDGTIQQYNLPSYGFLLSEIKRLQTNLDNITGIGVNFAYIKTSSGSIRAVLISELPNEPKVINNITIPKTFTPKPSRIFEKFVNPNSFVTINLSRLPNHNSKNVMVKKLLLKISSTTDLDFYTQNIDGKNDIDYDTIIAQLNTSTVSYTEYDEMLEFPAVIPKITGNFSVLNIFKTPVTQIIDGITTVINQITYRLDKSTYTDTTTGVQINLKAGDLLVENLSNRNDTLYEVTQVDLTTNQVILIRREGFSDIQIAANSLAIYPGFNYDYNVDIDVNANQYVVYWFKPVNPNLNIINLSWGSGIGLSTNALLNSNDSVTSLSSFYDSTIVDIGKKLESLAKEKTIAFVDGVIPDAPVLDAANFKVEIVNTHKQEYRNDSIIRQGYAQKNKLKEDLDKLDAAIAKQKEFIATNKFPNNQSILKANIALSKLQTDRQNTSTQYNSVVGDLVNKTRTLQAFDPVYRIRGFVNVPLPKNNQQIIQLLYEYRYLRPDNTSTESEVQKYTDASGNTVKAVFSKWVAVSGKTLDKTLDSNGNPIWAPQNVADPDSININQIDIPITPNEAVEIRMKSVSEAGYPGNPLTSDWSTSVIIPFPDSISQSSDFIATDAENANVLANLTKELDAIGVTEHISDSFRVQERYFAHEAKNVSTTFKTPENKPLAVDDVLLQLNTDLLSLKALVNSDKGQIQVNITDETGAVLSKVTNNDTGSLFTGYYTDLIKDAVIPKGEIVSKLYYIEVSNVSAADLGLLSYIPGVPTDQIPANNDPDAFGVIPANTKYTGYMINPDEYERYRKYWKVPVSIRSAVSDPDLVTHYNSNNNPFINKPSIQSSQSKGQFVYSRFRDISLNTDLFGVPAGTNADIFIPILTGSDPRSYIWDGTLSGTTPNGNGNFSNFAIHMNHPDLATGSDFIANFAAYFTITEFPALAVDANQVYYIFFSHSKYFNLEANDVDGTKQLGYYQALKPSPITNQPDASQTPRKFGFNKNDKYLIGANTCGMYLFLAPTDHKSLSTGSNIYNVPYIIKTGDTNKVRIPFMAQFRMTDYDGAGDAGLGILGGAGTTGKTNLTYTKFLGVDIPIKDQGMFSFDIKVTAIYKPSSVGDLK